MHTNELFHQENREWISLLDFYEDELRIFHRELHTISAKHVAAPAVEGQVEEYRMFFQRKSARIKEIRDLIAIQDIHTGHRQKFNSHQAEGHQDMREMIQVLQSNFEALKQSFKRFASRND